MKTFLTIGFWSNSAWFALLLFGPLFEISRTGTTGGLLVVIALLLAWIAGSLMWGLGTVLYTLHQSKEAAQPQPIALPPALPVEPTF